MIPKTPDNILTHWNILLRGLQYSSEEFYKTLEEKIAHHEVPQIRQSRVEFREGNLLSQKRKYLRIQQGEFVFDICGAPYGTESFFVSYWLGALAKDGCLTRLLLLVPVVGEILERQLRGITYYQLDTAGMFQSLVHELVLEVVDDIQKVHNLEPIPAAEKVANTDRLNDF